MTTHGYRVHQARIRTAAYVLLLLGLPVALMVATLWHLPEGWPIIVVLLLCYPVLVKHAWPRIQRAVRHELLFAIDADGVFFGLNTQDPSSVWEPWSRIDQVVYFTVSVSISVSATDGNERVRYVGIAQHGQIVEYRAAEDWHFDIDRAAAATKRFGQGTTLVEAPTFEQRKVQMPAVISLPSDWQTRHPRAHT